MNKRSLFLGILLSLMCVGIVSGSLYAEKIPDPNRFISIEPLWSVKLEKVDGGVITISLLEFVWEQEDGQSSTTMFYLDDGADEYIADRGSFRYAQESTFQYAKKFITYATSPWSRSSRIEFFDPNRNSTTE